MAINSHGSKHYGTTPTLRAVHGTFSISEYNKDLPCRTCNDTAAHGHALKQASAQTYQHAAGLSQLTQGAGLSQLTQGAGLSQLTQGAGLNQLTQGAGLSQLTQGAGLN